MPLECHPRDPLEELSIPVEGSIILPVFMTLNSMELAAIHIADILSHQSVEYTDVV